jgi:hypothetical protein
MRKLLVFIVLFSFSSPLVGVCTPPSWDNTAGHFTSGNFGSNPITVSVTIVAGELGVIGVFGGSPSITADSAGLTWVPSAGNGTTACTTAVPVPLHFFYALNPSFSGSDSITMDSGAGALAFLGFTVQQFIGVKTTGAVDGTPAFVCNGTQSLPNQFALGNITTTQTNDLLLTFGNADFNPNLCSGLPAGWVGTNTGSQPISMCFESTNSPGSNTGYINCQAAGDCSGMYVTFKANPAACTASVVHKRRLY